VAGALLGGTASVDRFGSLTDGGLLGILRSAGVLFFAFAGYARIATLGEEVVDPARTIPRAIPIALGLTLVVYAVVAVSALAAVGPAALAASEAPLVDVVRAGDLDGLVPAVRIGGAIAGLGVLLSLIAGVSRTTFAMAADGELPRWLAAVHAVHQVPHRAEVAAGAIVVALVAVTDLRGAIGFSSFCVLTYYGIANASAWTLRAQQRRWPRVLPAAGIVGCATLALTLPAASAAVGAGVLAVGALVRLVRHRR
jgi:APA family basic amino acid/polyamine antiporter